MKREFKWGQKIKPSVKGIASGLLKETDWAICLGYNRKKNLIVVRNNHLKADWYYEGFWEEA